MRKVYAISVYPAQGNMDIPDYNLNAKILLPETQQARFLSKYSGPRLHSLLHTYAHIDILNP